MFEKIKEVFHRIVNSRLTVLILAFCVMFAILVNRLFYLQIVKGDYYLNNYKLQIKKTRELSGTRGNIMTGTAIFWHIMSLPIPSHLRTILPMIPRKMIRSTEFWRKLCRL